MRAIQAIFERHHHALLATNRFAKQLDGGWPNYQPIHSVSAGNLTAAVGSPYDGRSVLLARSAMNPQVTEEMRQAIEAQRGGPINIVDTVANTSYVLIRADDFERIRPLIGSTATRSEQDLRFEVPTGVLKSQRAFFRDLEHLLPLRSRKRRWAAYHGDECIGFGRTETELYQECFRRGLRDDEFFVGLLERHPSALGVEEIDASLFEAEDLPLDAGQPNQVIERS